MDLQAGQGHLTRDRQVSCDVPDDLKSWKKLRNPNFEILKYVSAKL